MNEIEQKPIWKSDIKRVLDQAEISKVDGALKIYLKDGKIIDANLEYDDG